MIAFLLRGGRNCCNQSHLGQGLKSAKREVVKLQVQQMPASPLTAAGGLPPAALGFASVSKRERVSDVVHGLQEIHVVHVVGRQRVAQSTLPFFS